MNYDFTSTYRAHIICGYNILTVRNKYLRSAFVAYIRLCEHNHIRTGNDDARDVTSLENFNVYRSPTSLLYVRTMYTYVSSSSDNAS